jgi:aminoglycoside phosphotransferase family enzyme
MDNVLKEIAKKEVGGYHLKAFAHADDKNSGAMGVFVKNSSQQLHHTGVTAKDYAHKLYHSLNSPVKVEQFLNNVKNIMARRTPEHGFMTMHQRY